MSSEPILIPNTAITVPNQLGSSAGNSVIRKKKVMTQRQLDALRSHAFKPGQSGNPNGRPAKPITDSLHKHLMRNRQHAALEMAKAMIEKAKSGDVAAFVAIADRVEGKPTQRTEGEQEIHITVERIGD